MSAIAQHQIDQRLSAGRSGRLGDRDSQFGAECIDELEDVLEILDENGVSTREELEALIADLERRAAELETDD